MPILTSFTRRKPPAGDQRSGQELPEDVRRALPTRFEAVGEALASGTSVTAACTVAGRDVARDGAALGEALDGLCATFRHVKDTAPGFEATQAVSVAWAEATLEYVHQMSCADPLTGLASLAHVRTRLAELYREAEQVGGSVRTAHALVVVELPSVPSPDPSEQTFTRALRMVRLCEVVRTVFSGGETIGRLGPDSAVVVVRRDASLADSVSLLRDVLADLGLGLGSGRLRVWIEGLPAAEASGAGLLHELAR